MTPFRDEGVGCTEKEKKTGVKHEHLMVDVDRNNILSSKCSPALPPNNRTVIDGFSADHGEERKELPELVQVNPTGIIRVCQLPTRSSAQTTKEKERYIITSYCKIHLKDTKQLL